MKNRTKLGNTYFSNVKRDSVTLLYAHAPCRVECGGTVRTVAEYPNGARLLGVTAEPGECSVVFHFA